MLQRLVYSMVFLFVSAAAIAAAPGIELSDPNGKPRSVNEFIPAFNESSSASQSYRASLRLS